MKSIIYLFYFKNVFLNGCLGSELIEKALFIADKEFVHRRVTCIVWWHTEIYDVNDFLEKFRGVVATFQPGLAKEKELIKFHKFAQYKQTVFFATKPEEFKFFLNMIKDMIVSTIRVILIITKPVNNDTVLSRFTKTAWENDVGHIIILSFNSSNKISLTSYIPFSDGKCSNYKPIMLTNNATNYFGRNFQNFQRCPVRFTALQFPPFFIFESENGTVTRVGGIDGEVLKLLLERLNASMDIVSSKDHGGIGNFVNGTATGSFGDLVNGIADTMALSIILNYDRHTVAQLTYVYSMLDVMWCVPNRRKISAWVKVFLPFFTTITPFLILSFVVFIASTTLVHRFETIETRPKLTFTDVVYHAVGLFLGQTIEFMTNYWLTNSVFVLWIWFCLIVRVVYQGNLVDGFQRTILEPHLRTVEEALKSVDGYGGVPGFLEFYRNTSIEKNYQILTLDEMPIYIKQIAEGRRFLLAVDSILVIYLSQTVQFLDEPVTQIPVCFFTRPRWPAAEEFNKVIVNVAEAGFVAKILRDKTTLWLSRSNITNVESVRAIDFLTLSACFYSLFVMCCICTIILAIEIIYSKYRSRRNLSVG